MLYYYNRKYINNLFKKNIVNPPKITPRSINQRFIDIDSDIKNLNNELNQYILRSMENDLPLYKSYIDSKNYTQINNDYKIDKNIYWTLVESNDSSMIFERCRCNPDEKNDKSVIVVEYKLSESSNVFNDFKIKSIKYRSSDNFYRSTSTETLDNDIFKNIIFEYYTYIEIRKKEAYLLSRKEKNKKIIEILGKDIRRDENLDKILN